MADAGPTDVDAWDAVPSGELWEVLYEQTLRRADRHASLLGELRTRASIILTATGLVASLLGAEALRRRDPFPLAILPITALVGGLLCCLAVLRAVGDEKPTIGSRVSPLTGLSRCRGLLWRRRSDPREWQVTVRSDRLLELARQAQGPATNDLRKELVKEFALVLDKNHGTIRFRNRFLMGACWCLLAQVVVWMVVLSHLRPRT